jgi:hypothetical protein
MHVSYPPRRHRDDDYIDRIDIISDDVSLLSKIQLRYKTSYMSGDEWRISALVQVYKDNQKSNLVFEISYHSIKRLREYLPFHIYTRASQFLDSSPAVIEAYRKGHLLYTETRKSFGEAAIGLNWIMQTAGEGRDGVEFKHLSDQVEREHCQQVGCSLKPIYLFHLKELQVSPQERLMVKPEYDFVGQFVWYCGNHKHRGDCGIEDADKNLELIKQGDNIFEETK